MPIELDTDSLGTKRRCPSPNHGTTGGTPLTLEVFQSAMQLLIAKVGIMETRIAQVERAFTDRMKEQANLLTAITNTQSQHSTDFANLQNKDKANQDAFHDIRQILEKTGNTCHLIKSHLHHCREKAASLNYGRMG